MLFTFKDEDSTGWTEFYRKSVLHEHEKRAYADVVQICGNI